MVRNSLSLPVGMNSVLSRTIFALLLLCGIALIGTSAATILASNQTPQNDQYTLLTAKGYPQLDSGVSSILVVELIRMIVPTESLESLNSVVRAVTAVLYLSAGGLIALSIATRERMWLFLLFIALLMTSRFPFIWLSSEVLAGTFLMLVLWGHIANAPWPATALFVALLSLAKPDLLIPGLLAGLFLAVYHQPMPLALKRVSILAGTCALFFAAGIAVHGTAFIQFGSRSFFSFGQHYAVLVSKHQLTPVGNPWLEYPTYLQTNFPSAQSMPQVLRLYPRKYFEFVGMSVGESVFNVWSQGFTLITVLAIWCFRSIQDRKLRGAMLILLANVLLILPLAFVHVRYLARFYPLALIAVAVGMTKLRGWQRVALGIGLLIVLAVQARDAAHVIMGGWWLTD